MRVDFTLGASHAEWPGINARCIGAVTVTRDSLGRDCGSEVTS